MGDPLPGGSFERLISPSLSWYAQCKLGTPNAESEKKGYKNLKELFDRPSLSDAYLAALSEVWPPRGCDKVLKLIDAMLMNGGSGEAVSLSEEAPGSTNKTYSNLILGGFARQIADALRVREKGYAFWFPVAASGEGHEDGFHWRFHETFVEALRRFPPTAKLPGWAGMEQNEAEKTRIESSEGTLTYRDVGLRGRNKSLVDAALRNNETRNGKLACEICGYRPDEDSDILPGCGRSMLEVHHQKPLSAGERVSRSDDLIVLCPLCHKRVHVQQQADRDQRR